MRFPLASPLLALLVASHVSADPSVYNAQDSTQLQRSNHLVKRQYDATNAATNQEDVGALAAPKATYKGTEDAPVDGADGKPHHGPFVDTTPDAGSQKAGSQSADKAKAKPKSLDKFKEAAASIPEKNDGVMNDENRIAPKKGTTGTEGGVTERAKERKAKGNQEVKPQSPVTAPSLPKDTQDKQEKSQKDSTSTETKQDAKTETKETAKDSKKGGFGTGGYGLEKPLDLPDKPHNLPHPKPRSTSGKRTSPPAGSNNGWLHDTMPYTEDAALEPQDLWSGSTSPGSPVDDIEWHEWFHSFVLSLTMILFSEIGDKTFLVAALMAMRHDRMLVFSAAFSALILMTILSAVLGHAVPTLLPKRLTTFLAAVLFLVFGARMLREGLAMPKDSGVGEEMQEVEAELEEKEQNMARQSARRTSVSAEALESGRGRKPSAPSLSRTDPSPTSSRGGSPAPKDRLAGLTNLLSLVLSPAWVQTFIMTFLGEWGDRSQIATIAMAAGQDYWWVTLGAILGHACCTGVAVIGGRALAGRVSMRVVTIGGAVAFLVFGVIYIYECAIDHS